MRVLFITGTLTHGGAQRVISVVSSQLAEFGHDVSVIVFKRFENEYSLSSKVKQYSIAESEEEYDQISGIKRTIILRKLIKKVNPEVAVGFLEGGYALYLSSFGMHFKKVASARVNPKYIIEKPGFKAKINRFWFKRADAVVLQTDGQMKLLNGLCSKERCTVIANPISESYLTAPEHNYNSPVKRIIMVGRLCEQKDYNCAIEAMKLVHNQHPELVLDIFGQGDLQDSLEQKIRECKLEGIVNLNGWTQDVIKEHQNSDIYLMTSLFEGMPNSLMEAMASGLVCISTDCKTGPSDLIENEKDGFLVRMKDSNAIAQTILKIVNMTEKERCAIGNCARNKLNVYYSSNAIGRKWEALLKRLIEEK